MKVAYRDTSVLVAIAFGEPQSGRMVKALRKCDRLLSSNLFEAEFRSTLLREGLGAGEAGAYLDGIGWIFPDRPLTTEIEQICRIGHLPGTDFWHLACALFLSPDPSRIDFLSLDSRQTDVAVRLGFSRLDK